MLRRNRIIDHAAKIVSDAIDGSLESLKVGRVEQEPQFTDRMLGRIESAFEPNRRKSGIVWRAKTLTDRGKGAQEREFGADFVGVMDMEIDGYMISKGFLAQAKMSKRHRFGDSNLFDQCNKMLKISPASFVFVYQTTGVRIIPAIAIVGSKRSSFDLEDYHSRSPRRFFRDHFSCFIGDSLLNSPTPAMLEELASRVGARSAVLLYARNI